MRIPLLVPLSNGSYNRQDDELRYLLRSVVACCSNLGTIYLMTTHRPRWLVEDDGLVVVPLEDKYTDGKDANLFYKTHETLCRYGIGDFVWSADDSAVLRRVDLDGGVPILHNHRANDEFTATEANRWRRRLHDTIEWAWSRGAKIEHNYECHAPQPFNGAKILEGMEGVEYYPKQKTIYTTWRVVTNTWKGSLSQPAWKWTFEHEEDKARLASMTDAQLKTKLFLGYNNLLAPFVLARLARLYPQKTRWER